MKQLLFLFFIINYTFIYAQKVVQFDGVDDHIDAPNHADFNFGTNVTFEAWINADVWKPGTHQGAVVSNVILSGGFGGASLRVGNNGRIDFVCAINGVNHFHSTSNSGIRMATGQWHHIAGSYDGTTLKAYVDGVLVGSRNQVGTINSSTSPLEIGGSPAFDDRYFSGKIDRVRVWNITLTDAQIKANRYNKLTRNEAGLIAYYDFDNVVTINDTANEVADGTSSNHDATSTGMTNAAIVNEYSHEGTTQSVSGHINTSQTVNGVTVDDQTDAFDNSQDIFVTKIPRLPNETTGITESNINSIYHFIEICDNGGAPETYDVSLTFPTNADDGISVTLYTRASSSSGTWTAAGTAIASGGQVVFTGINSFSQFILASNGALNPSPVNDDACNAIQIPFDTPTTFENEFATAQVGEPNPGVGTTSSATCKSQDGWCSFELGIQNSVWFMFVAPNCPTTVDIEITGDSGGDTQLALWQTTDCGNFTTYSEVAANDDKPTNFYSLLDDVDLNPGETYYVQVDGYEGKICSNCSIEVRLNNSNLTPQITGDLSYCPSEGSTTLDAGTWTSYSWSNGESKQYIAATAGTYTVTVTNSYGCISTATTEVSAKPCWATVGVPTTNAESICEGDAIEVTTTGLPTDNNYRQTFLLYAQDNLGQTTFLQ